MDSSNTRLYASSVTAPAIPECRFCKEIELRNVSVHCLEDLASLKLDVSSCDAIESQLNIADAFPDSKTYAYRKTKREILHATSIPHASEGPALCDSCRHLNLSHLFSSLQDYAMEIHLGSVDALRRRSHCSFCNFVATSVMASSAIDDGLYTVEPSSMVTMCFAYTEDEVIDDSGVKVYIGVSGTRSDIMLRIFTFERSTSIQAELRDVHHSGVVHNRRLVGAYVDWPRVQSWVRSCLSYHPECFQATSRSFPKDFCLIDLADRRVVRYRNGEIPPYFALSYTWGQNPDNQYLATLKTIGSLEARGGLGSQASDLPKVIQDAIEVCLSFPMQYLWVDRLCIIQDDTANKLEQVNAMDTIFGAAEVVIVAASARDMNQGLAGVSQKRPHQPVLNLDDVTRVASLPGFSSVMNRSPWQKRGWTYQEAALGRRKLYFTATQTFFDCGSGRLVIAEDKFAEGSNFGISVRRTGSDTVTEYYQHIDQYNRRSLRHLSDIYKAIQGVTSLLYPDHPVYFGLPAPNFDRALLWRAHDGSQHRRIDPDVIMPGWSWSCTNSGIQRWQHLFFGTVVSWRICVEHPTGGPPTLESIKADHPPETWLAWEPEFSCQTLCPQLSIALAWKDCIETDLPIQDARDTMLTLSELQKKLQDSWPTYKDFWSAAFARPPSTSLNVQPSLSVVLQPGMLIGRVQLKRFPIHLHDQVRARDCTDCIHKDKFHIECAFDARPAGILEQPHPDLDWIRARSSTLRFAPISISEWHPWETCFDWILPNDHLRRISLRTGHDMVNFPAKHLWDTRAKWFQEQTGQHSLPRDNEAIWSLGKDNLPFERPPLLVNLMLLDYNGDIARCVCKGWMFLRIWSKQPGEFRTIGLDNKTVK